MALFRSLRAEAFDSAPPDAATELARTLMRLRWCAVVGQTLTVLVVIHGLGIVVPTGSLAFGIGVLAAFAVFVWWRLDRSPRVTPVEVIGHIAVDTSVLVYLLYLTGGATNPFVTLLIMPITLAAAALPLRYVTLLAAFAAASYVMLLRFHVPLAAIHSHDGETAFDLHVTGMAISFVITAAMLGYFIARLAGTLREREAEVMRERERALRDEGILAIAIQAAGAAHELNTPLSTVRTLLTELRREHGGGEALQRDLAVIAAQTDRCRDILRELVALGSRGLECAAEPRDLAGFVADCLDRFGLLRPEIEVLTSVDDRLAAKVIESDPSLRHALVNLLNNAADASCAAGSRRIEFTVVADGARIEFGVRDHGAGHPALVAKPAPRGLRSDKRDGLGLGLALANATAERFGGELSGTVAPGGGLLQRLRIPLRALGSRM
ncbi:MAG TPA: ATP-binding protein [Rhodanobacteraceae bacterium]|nr:ATP-binding protein [Rhodanobacteraceae bacterium]